MKQMLATLKRIWSYSDSQPTEITYIVNLSETSTIIEGISSTNIGKRVIKLNFSLTEIYLKVTKKEKDYKKK